MPGAPRKQNLHNHHHRQQHQNSPTTPAPHSHHLHNNHSHHHHQHPNHRQLQQQQNHYHQNSSSISNSTTISHQQHHSRGQYPSRTSSPSTPLTAAEVVTGAGTRSPTGAATAKSSKTFKVPPSPTDASMVSSITFGHSREPCKQLGPLWDCRDLKNGKPPASKSQSPSSPFFPKRSKYPGVVSVNEMSISGESKIPTQSPSFADTTGRNHQRSNHVTMQKTGDSSQFTQSRPVSAHATASSSTPPTLQDRPAVSYAPGVKELKMSTEKLGGRHLQFGEVLPSPSLAGTVRDMATQKPLANGVVSDVSRGHTRESPLEVQRQGFPNSQAALPENVHHKRTPVVRSPPVISPTAVPQPHQTQPLAAPVPTRAQGIHRFDDIKRVRSTPPIRAGEQVQGSAKPDRAGVVDPKGLAGMVTGEQGRGMSVQEPKQIQAQSHLSNHQPQRQSPHHHQGFPVVPNHHPEHVVSAPAPVSHSRAANSTQPQVQHHLVQIPSGVMAPQSTPHGAPYPGTLGMQSKPLNTGYPQSHHQVGPSAHNAPSHLGQPLAMPTNATSMRDMSSRSVQPSTVPADGLFQSFHFTNPQMVPGLFHAVPATGTAASSPAATLSQGSVYAPVQSFPHPFPRNLLQTAAPAYAAQSPSAQPPPPQTFGVRGGPGPATSTSTASGTGAPPSVETQHPPMPPTGPHPVQVIGQAHRQIGASPKGSHGRQSGTAHLGGSSPVTVPPGATMSRLPASVGPAPQTQTGAQQYPMMPSAPGGPAFYGPVDTASIMPMNPPMGYIYQLPSPSQRYVHTYTGYPPPVAHLAHTPSASSTPGNTPATSAGPPLHGQSLGSANSGAAPRVSTIKKRPVVIRDPTTGLEKVFARVESPSARAENVSPGVKRGPASAASAPSSSALPADGMARDSASVKSAIWERKPPSPVELKRPPTSGTLASPTKPASEVEDKATAAGESADAGDSSAPAVVAVPKPDSSPKPVPSQPESEKMGEAVTSETRPVDDEKAEKLDSVLDKAKEVQRQVTVSKEAVPEAEEDVTLGPANEDQVAEIESPEHLNTSSPAVGVRLSECATVSGEPASREPATDADTTRESDSVAPSVSRDVGSTVTESVVQAGPSTADISDHPPKTTQTVDDKSMGSMKTPIEAQEEEAEESRGLEVQGPPVVDLGAATAEGVEEPKGPSGPEAVPASRTASTTQSVTPVNPRARGMADPQPSSPVISDQSLVTITRPPPSSDGLSRKAVEELYPGINLTVPHGVVMHLGDTIEGKVQQNRKYQLRYPLNFLHVFQSICQNRTVEISDPRANSLLKGSSASALSSGYRSRAAATKAASKPRAKTTTRASRGVDDLVKNLADTFYEPRSSSRSYHGKGAYPAFSSREFGIGVRDAGARRSTHGHPRDARSGMGMDRDSSSRGGGRDRRGRGDRAPPNQLQITVSAEEAAQLIPTLSSDQKWKAHSRQQKRSLAARPVKEDETVEIVRKAQSLLNKLTLEKFERVAQQLFSVGITNHAILQQVVQLIFDKACEEPKFSNMYARLCWAMQSRLPDLRGNGVDESNPEVMQQTQTKLFRSILLDKCKREFETIPDWTEDQKRLDSIREGQELTDEDYKLIKAKRRALGNVKFIGEVYKAGILSKRIIIRCVNQMLRVGEGLQNTTPPSEEHVEVICRLLMTTGASLDSPDDKVSFMDPCMRRCRVLSDEKSYSSRIRFMLMDVLDMRARGWEQRIQESGPKKISEIRVEALQQAQQKSSPGGHGLGMSRNYSDNNHMAPSNSQLRAPLRESPHRPPRSLKPSDGNAAGRGNFQGTCSQPYKTRGMPQTFSMGASAFANHSRPESINSREGSGPPSLRPQLGPAGTKHLMMHPRTISSTGSGKRPPSPVGRRYDGRKPGDSQAARRGYGCLMDNNGEPTPEERSLPRGTSSKPVRGNAGRGPPQGLSGETTPQSDSLETSREPSPEPLPKVEGLLTEESVSMKVMQLEDAVEAGKVAVNVIGASDFSDAEDSLRRVLNSRFKEIALTKMVESYLNARYQERANNLKNLNHVLSTSIMSGSDLLLGLPMLMDPEVLSEYKIDIPNVHRYFGHVLGVLIANGMGGNTLKAACVDHFKQSEQQQLLKDMVAVGLYFGGEKMSEEIASQWQDLKGLLVTETTWGDIESPLKPAQSLLSKTLDVLAA